MEIFDGFRQFFTLILLPLLRRPQFLSEDIVIVVVGVVVGGVLPDVLDVLVHLESLLMHVIGKLLLFATLGARTHASHLIFKLKGNINLNHHCPLGKNIGKR
jgi:hypothetical protein